MKKIEWIYDWEEEDEDNLVGRSFSYLKRSYKIVYTNERKNKLHYKDLRYERYGNNIDVIDLDWFIEKIKEKVFTLV